MVQTEDYQLIRRIKDGDKQAFECLVQKYYSNIYAYCYRRTGCRETASDLTQDIFLKLVASIYHYTFSGKFINFLFTIAVNTCSDYLRRKKLYFSDFTFFTDHLPPPKSDEIKHVILNGQKYMETHIPKKSSVKQLFLKQIRYISPLLWLTQFCLLFILIFLTAFTDGADYDTAKNTMLLAAPLTAVLAVPELFKDISCGTLEIELTCKNSSASVFLIRLIIIGIVNISVIILLASAVAAGWKLYFSTAVIYGLDAVNVMYILNLAVFRLFKINSRFAVTTVSVLAAPAVYFLFTQTAFAENLNFIGWIILYIASSAALSAQCILEIFCISKRKGLILWNF